MSNYLLFFETRERLDFYTPLLARFYPEDSSDIFGEIACLRQRDLSRIVLRVGLSNGNIVGCGHDDIGNYDGGYRPIAGVLDMARAADVHVLGLEIPGFYEAALSACDATSGIAERIFPPSRGAPHATVSEHRARLFGTGSPEPASSRFYGKTPIRRGRKVQPLALP